MGSGSMCSKPGSLRPKVGPHCERHCLAVLPAAQRRMGGGPGYKKSRPDSDLIHRLIHQGNLDVVTWYCTMAVYSAKM